MIETHTRDEYKGTNISLLVYGAPFVGKTTFAATFPNTLVFTTDGNIREIEKTDFIRVNYNSVKTLQSGAKKEVSGWEIFKGYVNHISSAPDVYEKYETIVVDLLTDIYEMARQYILKQNGVEHESDIPYGKGYKLIDSEFLPVLKNLLNIQKNIVVITHEDTFDGKVRPNLQNRVLEKITGYFEIYGRLVSKPGPDSEQLRQLQMSPLLTQEGGKRFKQMDNSIIPTYEEIIKQINKEIN